jgi:hypothetical protein
MLSRFRHWTPRYVVSRLRYAVFQKTHPDAPWLNQHAVALLESWLRPQDQGLEWGSGRSTVWFARRVRRLVSIEHNPVWHERVKARLQAQKLVNVDCRLVPVEETAAAGAHPYVQTALSLPPASLDFVLVDGVLRDHCTQAAMALLKPAGLLILDNAEWYLPHRTFSPKAVGADGHGPTPLWRELAVRLKEWRCVWTSNNVIDAAFFVKPPS